MVELGGFPSDFFAAQMAALERKVEQIDAKIDTNNKEIAKLEVHAEQSNKTGVLVTTSLERLRTDVHSVVESRASKLEGDISRLRTDLFAAIETLRRDGEMHRKEQDLKISRSDANVSQLKENVATLRGTAVAWASIAAIFLSSVVSFIIDKFKGP